MTEILEFRKATEQNRISAVKTRGKQATEKGAWIDATPERLGHAADNGISISSNHILSTNGFRTGVKYRKIDSPIEVALKKKWIGLRQYRAGQKFEECIYAAGVHPRLIGKLEASVDGSRATSAMSDNRLKAQDSLRAALNAIPEKLRSPFFDWMSAGMSQDISVASFGAYFSTAKRQDKILAVGKRKLSEVLSILAKHYGF